MNMILAGDGHSNIHTRDSLANPVEGEYDVVVTNMPYSQKTKHGNLYDLPSANGDSICVQHCIKAINSLSNDGRLALVVPEGFLFRKDLAKAREYLLDRCQLQSIISLPQGVFLPYTGVKTNIIYATKVNQKTKAKDKRKDYWYFDVKSDGYTLDNHRRKLDTKSDLIKYEEYRRLDIDMDSELRQETRSEMLQVGFEIIPLDKVHKNSFVLVGSKYRQIKNAAIKYNYAELKTLCDLQNGFAFKSTDYVEISNTQLFRMSNIRPNGNADLEHNKVYLSDDYCLKYKNFLLNENDVVIAMTDMAQDVKILGIPTIVPKSNVNLLLNQRVGKFNNFDKSKLLFPYLRYILQSDNAKQYYKSLGKGGVQINLSKEDILNIQIPLPNIEIQQNIVNELDSYHKIINNASNIVEQYKPIIPSNISGDFKSLSDIAFFKPSKNEVKSYPDDMVVSFVPMADINTNDISFIAKEEKSIADVLNGFTYFKNDDILLAKITPCFENGKAGIARNLKNGLGFGSTEFVVIRANTALVYPEWIYYHINSLDFLKQGKQNMTGTAGQQRIDIDFIKNYTIVVPSLDKQRNILDNIQMEQSLIQQSKQLIDVFTTKINNRINEIWGGNNA